MCNGRREWRPFLFTGKAMSRIYRRITNPPLEGEFTGIQQSVHDLNTGNDAMTSTVTFRIRGRDGSWHEGSVNVKQIAGGDYRTDPLEVGSVAFPDGGPSFKYDGFRDLVEAYYRKHFGPGGRAVNVGGQSSVRMWGNTVESSAAFRVEEADSRAGW
jgi:hypothetical protein